MIEGLLALTLLLRLIHIVTRQLRPETFSGGWTVLLSVAQIPYQSHLIRASVVSVVYWRRKREAGPTLLKWVLPIRPVISSFPPFLQDEANPR